MTYYHSNYGVRRKKKNPLKKFILWLIAIVIIACSIAAYMFYQAVYKVNVWTPDGENVHIYIPSGSDFDDVNKILFEKGLIIHRNNYAWWAQKRKYPELVKPGHYIIKDAMNNKELVDLLRSGNQVPVKVIFNNNRDIFQLAGKVAPQIEPDSAQLVRAMLSPQNLSKFGVTKETIGTIFIPNTYECYWNISADDFVDKMYNEYQKFWNTSRMEKVKEIDMTIPEIVTLASIVEKETNDNTEKALIAGVYINRLENGWRLQADPTLIYALNDYSVKRVLNVHKDLESPYNTYKHGGLPPGPICIPSISSIDAVLNYRNDGYFYFCAKDDLSGSHVFAKYGKQHNKNARAYQKALDKMKIYK